MSGFDHLAVLYVDDEATNLRVFKANFRSHFEVICCESPSEALKVLSARTAEIGVLVSDQRMPEMTGVELLEKARALAPDVARMVITAYSDVQAVLDAVNRGQVARYFVKPWVREELQLALEDALRIVSLQQRLREIEGRMLRSERLATIGQVSAGIAHELMNPVAYMTQNVAVLRRELGGIESYVSRALVKSPDENVSRTLAELPQLLEDVDAGAKHIRQVAMGIRSHAREEEKDTTCDLLDVATFAVRLARAQAGQAARMNVNGSRVQLACGPVKLTQVLLNLLINAAQAMEGINRPGLIEINWDGAGDGNVLVSINDNGAGISPENMEKIFTPMFTTKPAGIGTGLGLAICRDLLKQMNAEISLSSKLGEGTKVALVLPRA